MKTFAKLALCAAVLAVAVFVFMRGHGGAARHPAQGETATAQAMPPVAPASLPPNTGPAVPVAAPIATTHTDETVATRQMYAAHAPLRMPEVADPDSGANRQILQTMVQKALQRKTPDVPANNPDLAQ